MIRAVAAKVSADYGPASSGEGLVGRAVAVLFAWYERARQRRHLSALDDRMLKDIGLTRADVEFEAGKHFWKG